MANSDQPSRASARGRNDEVVCTRRGNYAPPVPEKQSALSRWIVRGEAALIVALAVAVLIHVRRPDPSETGPIKFVGGSSILSRIAASDLAAATSAIASSADSSSAGADPSKGQVLFMQTCTSCHGQQAQGLPHMGVSLRDSKFVATTNDRKPPQRASSSSVESIGCRPSGCSERASPCCSSSVTRGTGSISFTRGTRRSR